MMSNKCDLLLDYFNNQLTREEQEEFELHLLACEECQEELSELQQLTEDLPYSSEAIEPPSGMKDRVLSNVLNEATNSESVVETEEKEINNVTPINGWNEPKKQKKSGLVKPLIAAVLTISLVGNAAAFIYLSDEDDDSETTTEPEDPSLDEIQKMVSLSPSEGISAEATAMMIEQNSKTNLVVQANDLPELEGNETYQVWVLEDGKPYRAGTFVSNENGNGAVSFIMNYEGKHQWDTIAITKEPDANSQTPQGDIVLSSPLS
ncbi:anti-sigma factor domain-containing protein [Virgibacillus flavescens]|uniref:anti-sigma factor domain-containing protein n=1 Tax=Virgibacillus flavescens TaxID=1611422 RepID=UPI003D33D55D